MRPTLYALGLGLSLGLLGCDGEETPDAGLNFEQPQILPDLQPVCLSYRPVRAGTTQTQALNLKNYGRQPLLIDGAQFRDIGRPNTFTLQGINPTAPTGVPGGDQAALQFIYSPTEPGWDYATLVVASNAENFPNLNIFTLAVAYPSDLDAGSEGTWDAGPKPDAAYANGEACTEQFRP